MARDTILLYPVGFGFAVCVWLAFPKAAGLACREIFCPHLRRGVCRGRSHRVDVAVFGVETTRSRMDWRRRWSGNGRRFYPAGRHFASGSRMARAADGLCIYAARRVECFAGNTAAHRLLVCVDFFGRGGRHDDAVVTALLHSGGMGWIGLSVGICALGI